MLLVLPGAGIMGGSAVPDSDRRKCAPLPPLGDCGSRESDDTLSDLTLADESDWPSLPAQATSVRRGTREDNIVWYHVWGCKCAMLVSILN